MPLECIIDPLAGVRHTLINALETEQKTDTIGVTLKRLARVPGVRVDGLLGTCEADGQDDGEPASVALVGA